MHIEVKLANRSPLYSGKDISGEIWIQLEENTNVSGVYCHLTCETVTRRVKSKGSGSNQRRYIKTDRDFPVRQRIPVFSLRDGEVFPAGPQMFPFSFRLPDNLAGTLESDECCDYFWCSDKRKYEINYWLEGVVATRHGLQEGEKCPIFLVERPTLTLHHIMFREGAQKRYRQELCSGTFGTKKGTLHATIIIAKLSAECGGKIPITIGFRNDSFKSFNKLAITLTQIVTYNVTSTDKYKEFVVHRQQTQCALEPQSEECTVGLDLCIPSSVPASTPTKLPRKIKIRYYFNMDLVRESGTSLNLCTNEIVVTSLPVID